MLPEKPVCRTRSNRTEDGTMDWFKIGKGVRQGCILSGFPHSSVGKHSVCNAGDPGSILVLGRSLEKEMETHSSILSWRIPWTEELGRLP